MKQYMIPKISLGSHTLCRLNVSEEAERKQSYAHIHKHLLCMQ